jgi:hypothetical protein
MDKRRGRRYKEAWCETVENEALDRVEWVSIVRESKGKLKGP